jgi:ERCC4-type nuclease
MILIDPRSGAESQQYTTTVDKMVYNIRQIGVECNKSPLEFGDAAFEGNGPSGKILIGVERKSLHDMLSCIDDSRYSGHQKVGMSQMYAVQFVMLEGLWRAHDPEGWLMEGRESWNQSLRAVVLSWFHCKYRSQQTLYSKLFRYMLSVSLSGVVVIQCRDLWHTCYNIVEIYRYFQKPFEAHTSMLEVPKIAIPDMRIKPSLVRKWATDLEDIGVVHSLQAEELFRTPIVLANASESDWMKLPRVGAKTARKIVASIRGWV